MNKQELIEALEELKESAKRKIETDNLVEYWQGKAETYVNAIGLAQQLDEPQKVKVPKCVAEWIEQAKKERQSLYEAMWNIESSTYYHKYDNAAYQWMFEGALHDEHQELFTEAYMHGYEVEKEPLYVMPVPHVSFPVHYCVEDDHISFRQGNAQKFTQAELDKYFPDIKQFAVPVDEVEG